jgi:hypothetical protein
MTSNEPFLIYTVLMASLKVCIYRYINSTSILVKSPLRKDDTNLPLQTRVLSIIDDVKPENTFWQFLSNVQQTLLNAYARQRFAPEDSFNLISDKDNKRVNNEKTPVEILLALEDIHSDIPIINNGICIILRIASESIIGSMDYNTNIFMRKSIEYFKTHFLNLLDIILYNPNIVISKLTICNYSGTPDR